MIKLFITDIDGCLTTPFETPDWELLSQIRRLNEQSKHDMAVPALTICSGRPMPYVEAVSQWLGIDHPALFENAGIYEVSRNKVHFLSVFDEKAEQQIDELKDWLQREIIDQYSGMILEFTKRMDAGLIHLEKGVIDDVFPDIKEYVEQQYPQFEVHKTDVSINIILGQNNKRNGIEKLCDLLDLEPKQVAYIGDSSGDIPGLQIVGRAFAPRNAADVVKEHAEVLEDEATEAVLSAYRQIIAENRQTLAEAG